MNRFTQHKKTRMLLYSPTESEHQYLDQHHVFEHAKPPGSPKATVFHDRFLLGNLHLMLFVCVFLSNTFIVEGAQWREGKVHYCQLFSQNDKMVACVLIFPLFT